MKHLWTREGTWCIPSHSDCKWGLGPKFLTRQTLWFLLLCVVSLSYQQLLIPSLLFTPYLCSYWWIISVLWSLCWRDVHHCLPPFLPPRECLLAMSTRVEVKSWSREWHTASWGGMETLASTPGTLLWPPKPRAAWDKGPCIKWSPMCDSNIGFEQLSGHLTHFNILKFFLQVIPTLNLHLPVHSSLSSFSFKYVSTPVAFQNGPCAAGAIRREIMQIFTPSDHHGSFR